MSERFDPDGVSSGGIVDAALAELLARPDMPPGAKLPTERALALELKVPRSAVRAALGRLESRRAIVRIMGSGTYVASADDAPAPDGEGQDASPLEIMETRLLIEPAMAQMIVTHASRADLDRIRAASRGGHAAVDFAEFEIWDARFHQAVAEATKNRLTIQIYKTITTSRDLTEWGALKRRSITESRRRIYNAQHDEILAALVARDAAGAEAALRAHLLSVKDNLFSF